jgi:hypothetical protein
MKVQDLVYRKTDREGEEVIGRVVAVNARARRVTVMWEGAKLTEEPSADLVLWANGLTKFYQ